MHNARFFRQQLSGAGFTLAGDNHPIVPVMIYDAALAAKMTTRLLELGIYVIGFSYPVVPKELPRIRTQVSTARSEEQLAQAAQASHKAAVELGVLDT